MFLINSQRTHGVRIGLSRLDGKTDFVRGFSEYVECHSDEWLACAETVLRYHPIRRVRLRDDPMLAHVGRSSSVMDVTLPIRQTANGVAPDFEALFSSLWPQIEFVFPEPVETLERIIGYSSLRSVIDGIRRGHDHTIEYMPTASFPAHPFSPWPRRSFS